MIRSVLRLVRWGVTIVLLLACLGFLPWQALILVLSMLGQILLLYASLPAWAQAAGMLFLGLGFFWNEGWNAAIEDDARAGHEKVEQQRRARMR